MCRKIADVVDVVLQATQLYKFLQGLQLPASLLKLPDQRVRKLKVQALTEYITSQAEELLIHSSDKYRLTSHVYSTGNTLSTVMAEAETQKLFILEAIWTHKGLYQSTMTRGKYSKFLTWSTLQIEYRISSTRTELERSSCRVVL